MSMAGYTWDDVGSARFPVDQFINFVCFSPPGTALFHQRNNGWTTGDHLTAQMIDALNYLAWTKTVDAHQKHPKHRPKPVPRPGMKTAEKQAEAETKPMTVAEYMRRTGMDVAEGGG